MKVKSDGFIDLFLQTWSKKFPGYFYCCHLNILLQNISWSKPIHSVRLMVRFNIKTDFENALSLV